jgi:hypothetical protein
VPGERAVERWKLENGEIQDAGLVPLSVIQEAILKHLA